MLHGIYDGNESDITFYTSIDNTNDIEPNGILPSTGGTINIKIINNTSNTINLTIGVITSKDNIVLPNYMKLISSNNEPKPTTLVDYITNLYTTSSKSTVENNSITYNYATEVNLMNDRLGGTITSLDGGNIRYYGASPNNYIYFNCSDYSNQSSDTCELWRIIGVFDDKVKIMRNESIGRYSWDISASTVNSGHGVNEWSQAKLMKLLNPGYESESAGGSLYYNSKSGSCYNNYNNSTTSCDFTSTGIKNDTTKNMIATVTYNTGYVKGLSYSNEVYNDERSTTVISNPSDGITRNATWVGKVAIPYASDYGYSADLSQCGSTIYYYNTNGSCVYNAWIYNEARGWLLTPAASDNYSSWAIIGYGAYIDDDYFEVYNSYNIYPTLYLNADEVIESGDGSQNNPYQLASS